MERERDPRLDDTSPVAGKDSPAASHEHLRAGDADRKKVADRLKTAVDEGRLGLDEYDERLTAAYSAKTYGELALLTADLPPPRSAEVATVATPTMRPADMRDIEIRDRGHDGRYREYGEYRPGYRGWRPWSPWRPWIMVSLITTGIWFFSGFGDSGSHYFWPIWVIGPWGLMLVARTIAFVGWRRAYHR